MSTPASGCCAGVEFDEYYTLNSPRPPTSERTKVLSSESLPIIVTGMVVDGKALGVGHEDVAALIVMSLSYLDITIAPAVVVLTAVVAGFEVAEPAVPR